MPDPQPMTDDDLIGFLSQQNRLQQALIEAQAEIIRLREQLAALTPPAPEGDVHWHRVSKGITATDAVASGDLALVRLYNEWIHHFGTHYVKPYVHLTVYAEMIAHMTRGLPRLMAELEVAQEFPETPEPRKPAKRTGKRRSTSEPLPFSPDAPAPPDAPDEE